MSLTVLLPVFNEELHLARCLDSVVGWADRVVVIDSHSADRTPEIAAEYAGRGVEFVQHAYAGPAEQKNWALDHSRVQTEWVLFLDADEWVSPELAEEIVERMAAPECPGDPVGYFLNRRILWMGKWIRHGGWFPNWNLRLFRRGRARYEQRRVHEHMECDGPTAMLRGHMMHEDLRDITHSIAKHNRYSNLEAAEYLEVLGGRKDAYAKLLTCDPLARRRWIKTKLWARLPGKPLLYFLWCYFVRLGFLDGLIGLRYHALHAMFKAFDEIKLWELRRGGATRAVGDRESPSHVCSDGDPSRLLLGTDHDFERLGHGPSVEERSLGVGDGVLEVRLETHEEREIGNKHRHRSESIAIGQSCSDVERGRAQVPGAATSQNGRVDDVEKEE